MIAGSRSLCAADADIIGPMLEQGLSAQRVDQDLAAGHGFKGSYQSVSRFVAKLKDTPEGRVWRVECEAGEEPNCFGAQASFLQEASDIAKSWLAGNVRSTPPPAMHTIQKVTQSPRPSDARQINARLLAHQNNTVALFCEFGRWTSTLVFRRYCVHRRGLYGPVAYTRHWSP